MLDNGVDDALLQAAAAAPANVVSRLCDDYPVPLTAAEREGVVQHVMRRVRQHRVVLRHVTTVRRGGASLQALVGRLEAEAAELERALQEPDAPNAPTTAAAPPVAQPGEKRPREETSPADAPTPAAPPPAPPARKGGGFFASAMFRNMQSTLFKAQREQNAEAAAVARRRERITRETRLSMVRADLAAQEPYAAPLRAKLARAEAALSELEATLRPLLALLAEMHEMEARYCACFSLRGDGSDDGDGDGGAAGPSAIVPLTGRGGHAYAVPFQPAALSAGVEAQLRAQVEGVLDAYLQYRARVDPIVAEANEERRAKEQRRVDSLLQVIGLGGAGAEESAGAGVISAVSPAAPGAPESAKGVVAGNVSSDDDDDIIVEEVPLERTDADDRRMVQNALSALDDFDEMY